MAVRGLRAAALAARGEDRCRGARTVPSSTRARRTPAPVDPGASTPPSAALAALGARTEDVVRRTSNSRTSRARRNHKVPRAALLNASRVAGSGVKGPPRAPARPRSTRQSATAPASRSITAASVRSDEGRGAVGHGRLRTQRRPDVAGSVRRVLDRRPAYGVSVSERLCGATCRCSCALARWLPRASCSQWLSHWSRNSAALAA